MATRLARRCCAIRLVGQRSTKLERCEPLALVKIALLESLGSGLGHQFSESPLYLVFRAWGSGWLVIPKDLAYCALSSRPCHCRVRCLGAEHVWKEHVG